jgi:hypothetical protein
MNLLELLVFAIILLFLRLPDDRFVPGVVIVKALPSKTSYEDNIASNEEESWSTSSFVDVPFEHPSQSNECPASVNETSPELDGDMLVEMDGMWERDHTPSVLIPKGFPDPSRISASQIFFGYPNGVERMTEKDMVAMKILPSLHTALLADEVPKATRLFNRLNKKVGLKNLRDGDLEGLLYALAKSPSPAPFTDTVLNEIKRRGIMNDLPLKVNIYSYAYRFGHVQIVSSLLPYIERVEERLSVINQPTMSSSVRTLVLNLVLDSELPRALMYTAKADLSTDFFYLLNRAMNRQRILLDARAIAKREKIAAKYMEALEEGIEHNAQRAK